MSGEELKNALAQKTPVAHNGILYSYISAIIYRIIKGKLVVTVELFDEKSTSVTIARATDITLYKGG